MLSEDWSDSAVLAELPLRSMFASTALYCYGLF